MCPRAFDPDRAPLDAFFLESTCPVARSDLGLGARLLVPNGLSFGALQARAAGPKGPYHDWFRDAPDRHHVPGSRHALHLGVDFSFFVSKRRTHMLPVDLPVRTPACGVVAATYRGGCPELEPGGLIIVHCEDLAGESSRVTPFTYLGDVREVKCPGDRVGIGEVVAHTIGQCHQGAERVVVHFGIGLSIPGHGMEFLDPCVLLKRWRVIHPVYPGSTCTPERLASASPGHWLAPGRIVSGHGSVPWDARWRTRF